MERMIGLVESLPWLQAFTGKIFVVKAGGELLTEPRWRDGIARDVALLHRLGMQVVLVHGGGPQLSSAAAALKIQSRKVAGRRITTPALINVAVMEWRGRLSLEWVRAIQREGESAVGISGVDGRTLQAARRPPAVVTDDSGERLTVDFGEVGDLEGVDTTTICALLGAGVIPVVTPLAAGRDGSPLNVNADTVAAALAAALGAEKLMLLSQIPGIQTDIDDPSSVLHHLTLEQLGALERDGTISGGMRPKAAAIRAALDGGVPKVHVLDGRRAGAMLEEVFTPEGCGTLIEQ